MRYNPIRCNLLDLLGFMKHAVSGGRGICPGFVTVAGDLGCRSGRIREVKTGLIKGDELYKLRYTLPALFL